MTFFIGCISFDDKGKVDEDLSIKSSFGGGNPANLRALDIIEYFR
jgi:hypothetical protein